MKLEFLKNTLNVFELCDKRISIISCYTICIISYCCLSTFVRKSIKFSKVASSPYETKLNEEKIKHKIFVFGKKISSLGKA